MHNFGIAHLLESCSSELACAASCASHALQLPRNQLRGIGVLGIMRPTCRAVGSTVPWNHAPGTWHAGHHASGMSPVSTIMRCFWHRLHIMRAPVNPYDPQTVRAVWGEARCTPCDSYQRDRSKPLCAVEGGHASWNHAPASVSVTVVTHFKTTSISHHFTSFHGEDRQVSEGAGHSGLSGAVHG